jgi:hypothetical protein
MAYSHRHLWEGTVNLVYSLEDTTRSKLVLLLIGALVLVHTLLLALAIMDSNAVTGQTISYPY